MPLETATFIVDLNPANPTGSDPRSSADDQLRLVKTVLKAQFPSLGSAAVTRTAAQLNQVGVTQTAGDNTAAPASTAFVQAAIAAVNAASGALTTSVSSSASITLTAGQRVVGTNTGQITYNAPASPSVGQMFAASPANGRIDNLVAFGANKHMGVSDSTMTINIPDVDVCFIWTGAAYGWKLV